MRQFATFMGVTHQSVMRWEKNGKAAAHIDPSTEIVMRIKVLRKLNSKKSAIKEAVDKVEDIEMLKPKANYSRQFTAVRVNDHAVQAAI